MLILSVAGLGVALLMINQDDSTSNEAAKPVTTQEFVDASDNLKYSQDYTKAADISAEGFDTVENEDDKHRLALQTAVIYASNKDYGNAIKWYLKADELKPGIRGSLVGLARSYEADGQKEKAIEYYKKVLELKDTTGQGVQSEQDYYQFRLNRLTGAKQ